jgi:hypothetical protein
MVRTSNAFRALAALTLATTSLAGCAKSDPADAAAQPQAKANASRSAIHNPQTDRSAAAVDLLAAVAAARGAIAGNDKTGAMTHVDAALGALPKIQKVGLVPIYTELSQQSVIGPVAAAKNMAARDAGAQENASSTMNNAAAPVAVKSVTTGFSRVLLDTSVARKMLDAARVAIGGGDLKAADKDLMTLEQSVVLESSAARMPLVRARENLSLASSAAARNDWGEVKAQLTSAANGLNDYAARAAATELADVRVLQQQIAKYAPNVESNHGDAASRINGWWVQAANLSDRT